VRSAVTDLVTGTRTGYGYDPDYDQLTAATSTRAGIPVKTYKLSACPPRSPKYPHGQDPYDWATD
jgi:hypothetical protein